MKKFIVNGEVYNIPTSEVAAFLKDFPNAQEARTYNVKGDTYDIALSEVDAFETDMGLRSAPEVKKKEPEAAIQTGVGVSKIGSLGTEKTPSSELELPSAEGETNSLFGNAFDAATSAALPKDYGKFSKGRKDAIRELNIKEEDLLRPATPTESVQVTAAGNTFTIRPARVPDGYTKDIQGARQFAIDINQKISDPQVPQEERNTALKQLAKINELGRLDDNKNVVNAQELGNINTLLGTQYEGATPEMVDKLKEKEKFIEPGVKRGFSPGVENRYGKAIKKVANTIQAEMVGDGEINTIGGDTRSDLRATLSGFNANVENLISRLGKENISNAFATGLESIKYTDKNRYDILTRRIAEGKTIPSTVNAELTNLGSQIIDVQNLRKLDKDELDIDGYYQARNEVAKQVDESFYKKPDILQKNISEVIAKHYEKDGTIAFGKWFVSDDEIDAVPASEYEEAGIDITRPEVLSAIKNIKKNEGIIPFDNAIRKDALTRELGRGFLQPFKGTAATISNLTTSDDDLRVQKELEPVNNYVSQRGEYFNKHYGMLADAFNGLGQFTSQFLLMQGAIKGANAIGGAFGGSRATALVATPEAVGASAIRQGGTGVAIRQGTGFGNAIIDKSNLIGRIAVPFVQSYDSYLKDALEKTDNPIAAKVSAFFNASMETASEQFFDNVKFGKQVISDFSKSGTNFNRIAKVFDKGVWDDAAQTELRDAVKDGIKNSMRIVAKGGFDLSKEAFEEVPVALSNFATDALLNPQAMEGRELLPELKDAFISGLVSFSIPTVMGTAGRLRQQFNNPVTQRDALMVAAMNRDTVLDAIYNQIEDGELDQQEANSKIQMLNTATATLAQMPSLYADGERMDEADKVKYLALSVQEKYLNAEMGPEVDNAVKAINETKIAAINEQKTAILNKNGRIVTLGDSPEGLNKPVTTENKSDADEGLLSEIRSKSGELLQTEELPFFIEQAANDPAFFTETHGDVVAKAVLSQATDEQLSKAAVNLAKFDLGHPGLPILEQEIERRAEALPPQEDFISIEDVLDKPATRNGVPGRVFQDGQTIVFAEEGTNREYELGNVEQIKQQSIKDWGLEQVSVASSEQGDVAQSVVSVSDAGDIQVRGSGYVNNFSNPLSAINIDDDGNVISVNLETKDGKKRTFRGDVAEDIAYQIHLKELNKDNETAAQFEQFVEADESSTQEILAGENEVTTQAQAGSNNEEVQRQAIQPKPRIRVTAAQVKAGQNNSLKPKKTRRSNAVQEQSTTENVLRNEGVRGEGGLQAVEQGNQESQTTGPVQEKVIPVANNEQKKSELVEERDAKIAEMSKPDIDLTPMDLDIIESISDSKKYSKQGRALERVNKNLNAVKELINCVWN